MRARAAQVRGRVWVRDRQLVVRPRKDPLEHPLMSRMHKPGDEQRSVVILRPDDWEEWLTTSNVEAARAMLQLFPADAMEAGPASGTSNRHDAGGTDN